MALREHIPSRSIVGARNQYREYKADLRSDFKQRCGYCDAGDDFFGGMRGYQIDHFAPLSLFPALVCTYSNLVYSCPLCNRAKSNKWVGANSATPNDGVEGFVDPCDPDLDVHITRDSQGRIVPSTPLGEYMVRHLNLRLSRHQFIWQAQTLKRLIVKLQSLLVEAVDGGPLHSDLLKLLVDVFFALEKCRSDALEN